MISRLFNMGKIPGVFHRLFPAYLWKKKTKERVLYLTFDDGPTPELSKWVADKLESFGGKGTFFQVANNVKKHPEITHELLERGHEVGNHSFHHLNGWKSGLITYLRDFRKAESTLREYTGHIPRYFRPPYGKITRKQAKQILKTHEIAMMDVMSCDYDPRLSGEECYQKVVRHAAPGSIVVFHDSLKAEERLRYVLPRILSYYSAKGYQFLSLSQAPVQLPPTR